MSWFIFTFYVSCIFTFFLIILPTIISFNIETASALENDSNNLIRKISKDYTNKYCNSIAFGLSKESAMNFSIEENKKVFKKRKGIDNVNEKELTDKGRSLVVSGTENVVKIHIHSENPDEVVEFSKKFGDISNENITNMDEQFDEMKNKVTQKFENEVSIVAVTSGEGIVSFLKKNTFGNIEFISNNELENMNNDEFNKFISTISSKKIILFGNSLQAFEDLSKHSKGNSKKLHVIKSINDSELVSCVFAFSPEIDISENLININSSLEENITFELKKDNLDSSIITNLVKDLDNRFIIIYHHQDDLEDAKKIEEVLLNNFKIDGVEFISHISNKYDFLISVEWFLFTVEILSCKL